MSGTESEKDASIKPKPSQSETGSSSESEKMDCAQSQKESAKADGESVSSDEPEGTKPPIKEECIECHALLSEVCACQMCSRIVCVDEKCSRVHPCDTAEPANKQRLICQDCCDVVIDSLVKSRRMNSAPNVARVLIKPKAKATAKPIPMETAAAAAAPEPKIDHPALEPRFQPYEGVELTQWFNTTKANLTVPCDFYW